MPGAIAGALVAAGLSTLAAGIVVGVGQVVLGLGVSAIVGRIRARRAAQDAASPNVRQEMIRQSIPPRVRYMGTVQVSGPVWWWANDNSDGTNRMFIGVAVNHGRIGEFLAYIVDELEVSLGVGDSITGGPYDTAKEARIRWRVGHSSETQYTEIEDAFGLPDVRGDGIATVLGIFEAQTDTAVQAELYPNGPPKLRVRHNGSVVWDPRSSTQQRDNEETWFASENLLVHLLAYMMSPEGYAWPWSRVEPVLDMLRHEADLCDELVLLKAVGEYEKRYRIAGGYDLARDPADVVAQFEGVADARVWQRIDGTLGIEVGSYREPTVSIGSEHVLGYDIVGGPDALAEVSGIRAQYLSPVHGYREQDADPWPNVAALVSDEGRSAAVDLTWVPSHAQARRVMKRMYLQANAPFSGSVVTDLAGLEALDERFIRLTIAESGVTLLDNASVEVTGPLSIDLAGLTVTIPFRTIGPEIDAWDPATEEGTAPALPLDIT